MKPVHSQSGLTLVEVMIVLVGTIAVLKGVQAVVMSTSSVSRTTQEFSTLNRKANGLVEKIIEQLYQADAGQVTVDPNGDRITFRRVVSMDGGVIVRDVPSVIEWVADPTDPNDGIDNNGNGMVDEGQVILRTRAGLLDEQITVLGSNIQEFLQGEVVNGLDDNGNGLVDERGLSIERDGVRLMIRIGMGLKQSTSNVIVSVCESSFAIRN
ncbi:MAG: hypothetical protein KDB53_03735 [Planctomycetes bacterium]|nr:hypothetical protein [Planctomycetota bacterium]